MDKVLRKAPEFEPGDIIFAPDEPHERMYRVIEVRKVLAHRSIVHVMYRDGDGIRELPNHIEYPTVRKGDTPVPKTGWWNAGDAIVHWALDGEDR